MKKILVILLLLVYGGSSFGMTLYFHYCCDKLQEVVLTPPEDDACMTGMDGQQHEVADEPCCTSKEVVLKINDSQTASQIFYNIDFSTGMVPLSQPLLIATLFATNDNTTPAYFTPPPLEKNFNQLFCVYRI